MSFFSGPSLSQKNEKEKNMSIEKNHEAKNFLETVISSIWMLQKLPNTNEEIYFSPRIMVPVKYAKKIKYLKQFNMVH